MERVNKGEDFEVVARELSECPSKSQGGSLGWFGKGKLALEVEAAAFDEANTPGSLTMVSFVAVYARKNYKILLFINIVLNLAPTTCRYTPLWDGTSYVSMKERPPPLLEICPCKN